MALYQSVAQRDQSLHLIAIMRQVGRKSDATQWVEEEDRPLVSDIANFTKH
jgi:hypothetical protein